MAREGRKEEGEDSERVGGVEVITVRYSMDSDAWVVYKETGLFAEKIASPFETEQKANYIANQIREGYRLNR